jgi:hypothetical protein
MKLFPKCCEVLRDFDSYDRARGIVDAMISGVIETVCSMIAVLFLLLQST